jgi:serine phosphatase RsbU (regulator of sigma subunit)
VEARNAYTEAIERLRASVRRPAGEARRTLIDRAVGLLAGRLECRLEEAHSHLLRLAGEQGRNVEDVAAAIIELLEVDAPLSDGPDGLLAGRGIGASTATGVDPGEGPAAATHRQLRRLVLPDDDPDRRSAERRQQVQVQEILDALSGAVALLSPVRDDAGAIVDYVIDAASPEATDVAGRAGAQMVGLRISVGYPTLGPEVWTRYLEVLETGEPAEIGPFRYSEPGDGVPIDSRFSLRAHRLGARLLVTWVRHDGDSNDARLATRIEQTERLGNLGWGEWDTLTGRVVWSDQLYRIFERDPADGPLSNEESEALALPDDLEARAAAAEAFVRGESIDSTSRMRINGRIKYIRTVADAVRDASGRPLKIYGIVQDVTARETMRVRLDRVEQQLAEQQRTLRAEHEIASQLQHIILPIPEGPVDLPGLRVGVRYLPAEHLSHVGGDWYHAVALADGSTLLAVGDVAGHGMLAATTMAQVRHALRGLMVTTSDPAELMGRLNQLMVETASDNPAATATAVIARYDPVPGTLTWAQAGHPAPMLSRRGVTGVLPRPPGVLLGVTMEAEYVCATVEFVPGDVLIMYTDGLVEHRNRTLDDSLSAVMTTVDEAIAGNPDQPLAALLGRLRRANPEDDTCVLAARPLTAPATQAMIASEDHHG